MIPKLGGIANNNGELSCKKLWWTKGEKKWGKVQLSEICGRVCGIGWYWYVEEEAMGEVQNG